MFLTVFDEVGKKHGINGPSAGRRSAGGQVRGSGKGRMGKRGEVLALWSADSQKAKTGRSLIYTKGKFMLPSPDLWVGGVQLFPR